MYTHLIHTQRLKENTWLTKESIIQSKILPYLGQRKMSEITAKDVIDWQNAMRSQKGKTGKTVSPTYLKTIHGQLSSIFNHAIRYYDLNINPARKAGTMGTEESKEMLYWCGIREGELLALTPDAQSKMLSLGLLICSVEKQRMGKLSLCSHYE